MVSARPKQSSLNFGGSDHIYIVDVQGPFLGKVFLTKHSQFLILHVILSNINYGRVKSFTFYWREYGHGAKKPQQLPNLCKQCVGPSYYATQ